MTSAIDGKELWRQIPPEEKIELLSRAHAIGTLAMLTIILCGGTMAVGLQMPWFLWGALLASPLVFQVSAGRAWKSYRPRMMLEYLGARSAARRFAFTAKAKDLGLKLVFRGYLEEVFDKEDVQKELEATIEQTKTTAVWVALFADAVVKLSERPGGAVAEFAQPITEKLGVEVINGAEGDYGNGKEVLLAYESKLLGKRKVRVSSRYPAAMVVFEKTLLQSLATAKAQATLAASIQQQALPEPAEEEEY